MGYRMSLACTCEEGHYFLELDDDFASTIWQDSRGVLKSLGVQTIAAIGAASGEDEEEECVEIEPPAFMKWLDVLAAQRAAIQAKLNPPGERPSPLHRTWGEANFARELQSYRELAEHALEAGTKIDASWA